MRVFDKRDECERASGETIEHESRELIVLHRFGGDALPGVECAADIARWYRENPEWTGGRMPYHFVVHATGYVEQALGLREKGAHARRYNKAGIGVAAIGDFRVLPPSPQQWRAAAVTVAGLLEFFGLDPFTGVRGHDELLGGSRDPGKRCPGRFWHMGEFRAECADEVKRVARALDERGAGRRRRYLELLGVQL